MFVDCIYIIKPVTASRNMKLANTPVFRVLVLQLVLFLKKKKHRHGMWV